MALGSPPQRMLVVLGNVGLGDTVGALPVFEMIRERWPEVHLAVTKRGTPQRIMMLEVSPHISELVSISGARKKEVLLALRDFFLNLKVMRNYDIILFLYRRNGRVMAWPMVLAAKLAGAKLHHKHQLPQDLFPWHVMSQLIAMRLLGLPIRSPRAPKISLATEDKAFAKDFFMQKGLGGNPTVLFNAQIKAAGTSPWGIEKYVRVANALIEQGIDVLLNGGIPSQIDEIQTVRHELREEVVVIERPLPLQLAANISQCDLFVGDPSGPTYIAMAVGTPTLTVVGSGDGGIIGNTRFGPWWWPWGTEHRVLSKVEWCQATMGDHCSCRQNFLRKKQDSGWKRTIKKGLMKPLGIWKPWKRTMKFLGLFPKRPISNTLLCLQGMSVEEVVEAAKLQLRGERE